MEKHMATLKSGTVCTAWNYSAQRLAAGTINGVLSIFDSPDPASSSSFSSSSSIQVHEGSILKVVWVPPEYGDAVACILDDGTLSLWEEVAEDGQSLRWKLCTLFKNASARVLDIQFGGSSSCLMLVAAYSDGYVKVYELQNPLELNTWQLQAEFQNVIDSVSKFAKVSCSSASISWIPQIGESHQLSFILGFNSDIPQLNSSKVWEFDRLHQRWLPVAELALSENTGDPVYAVAWAPNIGRSYEIIAVATQKGISMWHVGLHPDADGHLSVENIALLSGHQGEVWQMEWDMSGMTLASTGSDGVVRLWQSNLNGVWHEQAILEPSS
ncbi:protein SEH1 [Amaranthus tricolor]|uniref:protein SEH1 n=1 Tax=Amaranthus tricolor TaxID=29722 RepID=UPI00258B33D3|nr:protein SEH1 [Amaranthus tricolor]